MSELSDICVSLIGCHSLNTDRCVAVVCELEGSWKAWRGEALRASLAAMEVRLGERLLLASQHHDQGSRNTNSLKA